MAETKESTVLRGNRSTGDNFLVFEDDEERVIQAVALVDSEGNKAGTGESPSHSFDQETKTLLSQILADLQELKLYAADTKRVVIGGCADGTTANVTKSGELVVGPSSYDETEFNELAAADTAYNFYIPSPGCQFVMTGLLAYADKQVSSNTNATVVVYEADSPESTTVDKVLIQFELGQNQSLPYPNIRILVNSGVWVNAKTDDDDIHMTIMGHFIDIKA